MIKRTLPLAAALAMAISSGAAFAAEPKPNQFWWPDQLNLNPLRAQAMESSPLDPSFNYAEAFNKLDLNAVKADIQKVMTTSQDWWPADYGTYAPFFIRMAWHSAGTYRIHDGRGGSDGGQQRFDPLNSWPDNASLDKARRLVLPVKLKYGNSLSWGDLMVLSGNVALESMGFKTFGFAGGRVDQWEPDLVYWGPEAKMLATSKEENSRYSGDRKLENPLAAVQMGLIYVNPEGPDGVPDPQLAANDIRTTFGNMAMNDEETVALIAGGHTFGKAHGAVKVECIGAEPAAAGVEAQGLGWANKCGTGKGIDAFTSGLEGAWSASPTRWSNQFLDNLFNFEWEQTRSPAGAIQWVPKNADQVKFVPDAHDPKKRHAPIMFTTDVALKVDPAYNKIAKRFQENPDEFQLAFAKAWFKLTHRDLGPVSRYLGPEVPTEELIWQDPVPKADYDMISAGDVASLKSALLKSGVSEQQLISTAWASAATYRGTDMRGGTNGARIRLAPQKDWAVNNPKELQTVLNRLERVQKDFNGKNKAKQVSLADLIVLGGSAAIEQAAKRAGVNVTVPFNPGRTDATQAQTDVESFAVLEPKADAFRNYYGEGNYLTPTEALVERAAMLELTVPEMTVLVGGMRTLNVTAGGAKHGVFTDKPGTLSNDFFVNLLDMSTQWTPSKTEGVFEGRDRTSGKVQWTATPVDLVFGSNSELRTIAEVYGAENSQEKFVNDFVKAWTKVMNLGRFDL